ncbi:hypothetical protein LSAT2_005029 [Lamellibrachia satsuma]|nr:hypothetical protein LSAT2_005029 [Lamellibrachia satsuma]
MIRPGNIIVLYLYVANPFQSAATDATTLTNEISTVTPPACVVQPPITVKTAMTTDIDVRTHDEPEVGDHDHTSTHDDNAIGVALFFGVWLTLGAVTSVIMCAVFALLDRRDRRVQPDGESSF